MTTVVCSAADVHAPAANTDAIVTYAAVAGQRHVISGIVWSYDDTPVGGNLLITDGGVTVFSMDISNAGAGFIPFEHPKASANINTALVITLAAGGVGVVGKVSIPAHWLEQE